MTNQITQRIEEVKKKCLHNLGWCSEKDLNLFIYPNGKLAFDFQGEKRKEYKIKFICNNPHCDKIRFVYISKCEIRLGKIRKGKLKQDVSKGEDMKNNIKRKGEKGK